MSPPWHAALLRQTAKDRADIAKATGINCLYGNAPFFVIHGEKRQFAVCVPAPPVLSDIASWDADPDCDVIVVDWKTGRCTLLEDSSVSLLVGRCTAGGVNSVFTDARIFCRKWAASRSSALNRFRDAAIPGLHFDDELHGRPPGLVVAGDINRAHGWSSLLDSISVQVDKPDKIRFVSDRIARAAAIPEVTAL